MFLSDINIKEGAFFISDAHYSSLRPQLLDFFYHIESAKLSPTQIFLMGDIFDTLFGSIQKTIIRNQKLVDIINNLSQKIEIIYLEGNHDFQLQTIFPNVKVFSIAQQPLECTYEDKKVILAHGDFDGSFWYKVYTAFARNKNVLRFLNLFDTFILNKLDTYLAKKDDCKELSWFEDFISKRIENNYNCDYFIEGHFHQNKSIALESLNYINLGAFACNQRYFVVESSKDKIILEENIFSQGEINYG